MRIEVKLVSFLAILGLILFFFYSVGEILVPFLVSIIVAYLLDPFTKKIQSIGLKRTTTVAIIVGAFTIILFSALINLVPALFDQIQQFILDIPNYEKFVSNKILPQLTASLDKIDPSIADNLQKELSGVSSKFFEYLVLIIKGIFNSGMAFLNLIILVLLTPVLVFYLLRDWSKFIKSSNSLFPMSYRKKIVLFLKKIDRVLSAYIRGQVSVCLLMSLFYFIALSLIGFNNALLIGIIIGLLTIIPYLGVIIGFTICTIGALLQFADMSHVLTTIVIFIIGHALESFFITPKLIGSKVGLHPVWIIFALMAGGALLGFWGLFFAIPVAAVIGVVLKEFLKYYFSSSLYKHKKEQE